MASPVIRVPKPARSSFQPHRALSKLLRYRVKQFRELEKGLPLEDQTGITVDSIETEGQAAEYIRLMTERLHRPPAEAYSRQDPEHKITPITARYSSKWLREKELWYQELIERKYTGGLNQEEETALRTLTEELEAADELFYRPLIDSLKKKLGDSEPEAK